MRDNSSTRIGISAGLMMAVIWVSCVGSAWVPYFLAGAVLYLEKDKWLRSQAISVLIVVTVLRGANRLLFDDLYLNVILHSQISDSAFARACGVFEIAAIVIEDVIYLYFAYKAYKKKAVAANFINKIAIKSDMQRSDGDFSLDEGAVCPKCGREVSKEMDFCIYCGEKLR